MKAGFFIVVGLCFGLTVGYLLWKVPPVITKTVTITDTVPKPYAIYYPKTIYKDTGSHTILIDSVPFPVPFALPVDTIAIIKDYLAVKRYNVDSTVNEIHAVLNMDIYANRVLKYDLSLTNNRICNNITNNGFKIGLMAGKYELSPLIGYQHKQFEYLAGYNVLEGGIRIGLTYKIKP